MLIQLEKTRDDLAKMFYGTGAEIGVMEGKFSAVIAQYAAKLYCIDPWLPYKGYRDYTRKETLNRGYEAAKAALAPFPNCEIVRKFSMDAVKDFEDNILDFVYIDANHGMPYVLDDITEWSKKVKPGGIVAGHDYIKRKNNGYKNDTVEAVQQYTKEHNIEYQVWRGSTVPNWIFIKP